MTITITITQLEDLLYQQKYLCRDQFQNIWQNSEVRKELKTIDPTEKILNKMHEVRDKILGADFPDDFKVLTKYNVKD